MDCEIKLKALDTPTSPITFWVNAPAPAYWLSQPVTANSDAEVDAMGITFTRLSGQLTDRWTVASMVKDATIIIRYQVKVGATLSKKVAPFTLKLVDPSNHILLRPKRTLNSRLSNPSDHRSSSLKAQRLMGKAQQLNSLPDLTPTGYASAFSYLQSASDRYQQTVDVYTDADAAGNHFAARGDLDDTDQVVQFPAMDEISTATACDSGITCITAKFNPLTYQYDGWYFLNGVVGLADREPSSSFGVVPNAGTDLTGATTLTFWARAAVGGEDWLTAKVPNTRFGAPTVSFSQRLFTTDTRGTTNYTYDSRDQLTKNATPEGSVSYTYEDARNLKTFRSSNTSGASIDYSYDSDNRLSSVKDNRLTTGTTTYTYDAAGNRVVTDALSHATTFKYDPVGNQTSMTDPNSNTIHYQYDNLNRLTAVLYPDSTTDVTGYAPLSRTLSKTDQARVTTPYIYDALGRLTQVTDALGHETKYGYDEVGNRISQTDANNHTTTFAYDALDRRTECTLPAGQSESMTYDNALTLIAFLAAGDIEHARTIADSFVYVQSNDRFFTDGRVRNAYQGGDLILPPGWIPNKELNTVRMPGWYDSSRRTLFEDATQVHTNAGSVPWAMLALLYFYETTNEPQYLHSVQTLGAWVIANTWDTRGTGGFIGGCDSEGDVIASASGIGCASGTLVNGQRFRLSKTTEHNIDLYAAFSRLALLDTNPNWSLAAQHAKAFFMSMWDPSDPKFWTGTDETGVSISTCALPLDIQAWATHTLGVLATDGACLNRGFFVNDASPGSAPFRGSLHSSAADVTRKVILASPNVPKPDSTSLLSIRTPKVKSGTVIGREVDKSARKRSLEVTPAAQPLSVKIDNDGGAKIQVSTRITEHSPVVDSSEVTADCRYALSVTVEESGNARLSVSTTATPVLSVMPRKPEFVLPIVRKLSRQR